MDKPWLYKFGLRSEVKRVPCKVGLRSEVKRVPCKVGFLAKLKGFLVNFVGFVFIFVE